MNSLALLLCPGCGCLSIDGRARCANCDEVGQFLDERFVTFDTPTTTATAVLSWPDEFVRRLPGWADDLQAGKPIPAEMQQALQRHQLATESHALTPLGENVRYHLDEFRWQQGRGGLDGMLELASLGAAPRILDIGCGAGQTLRQMQLDRPVALVGVDRDQTALALGLRLSQTEGKDITLVAADATGLPFSDNTFDLVLTRVALNYMHQRTALQEMTRVLRPGGMLFCKVENVRHDLAYLRSASSLKEVVCRIRDLAWGSWHAATGLQLTPGSTLRGGRAFGSPFRLRRILRKLGCQVVQASDSPNGPTFAGGRTQTILLARKMPQ